MIVDIIAVLAGEFTASAFEFLLDRADRMPEKFNTPEKQKTLEKARDNYAKCLEFVMEHKKSLKERL